MGGRAVPFVPGVNRGSSLPGDNLAGRGACKALMSKCTWKGCVSFDAGGEHHDNELTCTKKENCTLITRTSHDQSCSCMMVSTRESRFR